MVATIAPLVEGDRRKFWLAWSGHFIGGALGGALLGAMLSVVGSYLAIAPYTFPVVAALILLYALHESRLLTLPLPSLPTAVPFDWRIRFGRVRAAWLYGFALAFGFTGRTPFATFHALLLLTLLMGDVRLGAAALATYGMSRALAPLFASMVAGGSAAERLLGVLDQPRAMHLLNAFVLALTGAAILVRT
jgi:hypothetical protein